jgi:hypothetical protein
VTTRRRGAALLCAALLLGPLAAGAGAQAVPDGDVICPPDQVDRFTDDDGSVHERSINCAATYGLVFGIGPATFGPNLPLNRGQAATILIGYVEQSLGEVLPQVPDGARPVFTDTAGNVHENNIERAEDNGILTGFADGTFRPGQPVTRAQFATIVVQATEAIIGEELGVDRIEDFDDDDASVHEVNIEKAFDNGILNGAGPRTFNPGAPVTRGQATTILVGALVNVLLPLGVFD